MNFIPIFLALVLIIGWRKLTFFTESLSYETSQNGPHSLIRVSSNKYLVGQAFLRHRPTLSCASALLPLMIRRVWRHKNGMWDACAKKFDLNSTRASQSRMEKNVCCCISFQTWYERKMVSTPFPRIISSFRGRNPRKKMSCKAQYSPHICTGKKGKVFVSFPILKREHGRAQVFVWHFLPTASRHQVKFSFEKISCEIYELVFPD